ncbi:MAG: NAD/FAD-utilizing enzyme [Halioglobus sp.]
MKRHYYISTDLDDLELVEQDLERAGVSTPQIHVLSEDDAGVETHHLHEVEAVLKKDVVHGTERGAIVGVIAAAAIIAAAWFSGLTETYTWVPAIFLAIIVLGFCTWEGGLIGIQEPHTEFKRFQDQLHEGKHILFVDIPLEQEEILKAVVNDHPKLQDAGEGESTPGWVIGAQRKWNRFIQVAP